MPSRQKAVRSHFKLVFLSVVGLILFFSILMLYLSVLNQISDKQDQLFSLSADLVKILIGAVAGLLGGKAL